jgi:hypothetical protein
VVDGAAQFSGGDARRAAEEIDKAGRRAKADIRIVRSERGVRMEISGAPNAADVMLALADNAAESQVAAGENKGVDLRHVAVVRSLRKIGSIKRGGSFATEVGLPAGAATQRVVVFLQESGQARVSGAAMLAAGGV